MNTPLFGRLFPAEFLVGPASGDEVLLNDEESPEGDEEAPA